METLLNATWLVIAIAFIAIWHVRWRPKLRKSRAGAESFSALALVLVLLFPVISLTDDLHADLLIAMPETRSSRALLQNNHAAHTAHETPCHPPAAAGPAAPPRGGDVLVLHGLLAALNISSPDSQLRPPAEGRAPPVRS